DLRDCKSKLTRLIHNEKDSEKRNYMLLILNSLDDYIKETEGIKLIESIGYSDRLAVISSEIISYKTNYSLVSLFYNLTSGFIPRIDSLEEKLEGIIDERGYGAITGATITNDQSMSLMDSFYKSFSPSLYPFFKRAYDQRKTSVRFVRMDCASTADSVYFDIIDRYFINSSKTKDISKLYNNIHEFGHVISYLVNPKAIYLTKSPIYTEVASMFPELVARYENIGNYDATQLAFDNYAQLVSLVGTSVALSLHTPLVNLWKDHNCDVDEAFFQDADKFYDCDNDMVDDYLDTYIIDDGDYVVSYLATLELFNLYKRDKAKALKIYEDILRCPYDKNLNDFVCSQLDLGSHISEETEQIIDQFTLGLRKSGVINV
ncbi:MAG: hypothetical protein K2H20_00990, partial [Bacilli bacterium]|nr:hypothetical protein [Bacilli bacterium]